MEILQTIWNALTTENEVLVKIFGLPLTFIEAYITMLLFTTILNIESTKKDKCKFVLSFSFIAIIAMLFIPTPFNTIINIISFIILTTFIFKINILKSIIAEIIPYIIIFVISFILLNLYLLIFNIPNNIANTVPIYKFTFSVILYLTLYFIYVIFKKCNLSFSSLDDLKNKNKLILLTNFVIGIIAISIQLVIQSKYNIQEAQPVFITSILCLLCYFIISIYSLSRTAELEKTSRDLEGEKLLNKSLTILHDNIRAFKHDFHNIVQSIGGYLSTNDLDGLKKYYSQLFEDCQRVNNLTTLNPEVINNPALYSLLADKYHKADELGIKIDLKIFVDLQTLKIATYSLTRILGILLDNAIEATLECDEKLIDIEIIKDEAHRRDSIIIKNTYLQKDINLDKIYEKSYSTKPNNTGLGLWEVRQILKKNNNLDLFTTKNDKFFIQQFEIYFKPIK